MKSFRLFVLIFSLVVFMPCPQPCEQNDPDLEETLRKMKQHLEFFQNDGFPGLPTEEDFNQLEAVILRPGFKLPSSLKTYHLTLGNLVFGGVLFPTAHSIENDGKFRSNLLYFIREGHENGVPYNQESTWIPFADNNGTHYICINLYTEKICYFCISCTGRLIKEKKEYDNFSKWLKDEFLSK